MKPSKYTEERIIGIPKERQGGMKVADLTRKYAVSEQSIYRWQAKYGGMTVSEAKRLRQFEEKNTRLKRMVAEFSLDKQMFLAQGHLWWGVMAMVGGFFTATSTD